MNSPFGKHFVELKNTFRTAYSTKGVRKVRERCTKCMRNVIFISQSQAQKKGVISPFNQV
jgi:hypothetical protein